MRKLLIAVGVLIVLLVAAALALPALVPSSVYKSKIEEQIAASLGRDVEIGGDVSLSVFPTLRAKADNVKIANAEGFSASDFASMDTLEAGVKLIPLLSKNVEITQFTLINPKLSFEKNADGQVNWAFGDPTKLEAPATDKPFARDGRYNDLQVALGKFALDNGQIQYVDAQKGADYALANVNVKMTMPGMDQPFTGEGDLVFNDIPIDIELSLNTPRSFLNGDAAPFKTKIKSELIDMSADGQFTPGQAITFDAAFDGNVPSVSKLDAMFGLNNPYGALTESARLKGQLSFNGLVLEAKDAEVSLKSELISNEFKGDFTAGPAPSASGEYAVNITSLPKLLEALQLSFPQVDVLETINLTTSLTTDGKITRGENVKFNGKGDLLDIIYTGGAAFENALSLNGDFKVNSPSVPSLVKKLNMAAVPATAALGDLEITGKANGLVTALQLADISMKTRGDDLNASYDGALSFDDGVALNGTFSATSPSIPTLVSKLEYPANPAVNVLGDLDVKGQISGGLGALKLAALEFNTNGSEFNAGYLGNVSMGAKTSLDGNFTADARSIKNLAQKAGLTLPYTEAIGKFAAQGQLNGPTDNLNIAGLKAALTEGQLNLEFDGSANTGKTLSYDGQLKADIPSLRALAAISGAQLPPSTEKGQVYETVTISGKATGNATQAKFANASFTFDDLVANGNFNANLTTAKPMVDGVLDMQGLDLRPYMAAMSAQRPQGQIVPWSEEPLNFAMLNLFDGVFTINTPNIVMDRLSMGQSTVKATIKDGVLNANLPNANLYGGIGDIDVEVNAKSAVPQVAMDFKLDRVDGKSFLGAAAGFTQLSGDTGTTMKIRGSGNSQAAIMRSLSGNGDFKLSEGVVTGVDIAQFVGGLEAALQTRALPAGIGNSYSTPFSKLDGLFTIDKGVVTIGDFALNGDNVLAEGAGKLDLGNQSIDFSLRPRLAEGSGLAAFGIPIKFQGNFGAVSAGLDTELLGRIVAERAQARLQNEISNQVSGGLGNILGGVLGTPQPTAEPAPAPETGTTTPDAQQPAPEPKDPVAGLLGDILGSQTTPPATEPQTQEEKDKQAEEEKKEEDPLDKALNSLFGNE